MKSTIFRFLVGVFFKSGAFAPMGLGLFPQFRVFDGKRIVAIEKNL